MSDDDTISFVTFMNSTQLIHFIQQGQGMAAGIVSRSPTLRRTYSRGMEVAGWMAFAKYRCQAANTATAQHRRSMV